MPASAAVGARIVAAMTPTARTWPLRLAVAVAIVAASAPVTFCEMSRTTEIFTPAVAAGVPVGFCSMVSWSPSM